MKHLATFLILAVFVVSGCSRQKELAQSLSAADHIVATNRYQTFGCTISGPEVGKLAQAVGSASRPSGLAGMDVQNPNDWDLEFYAGTNSLAVMHLLNHGFFQLEGVEYDDGTGVAETFWKKLGETEKMNRLPKQPASAPN